VIFFGDFNSVPTDASVRKIASNAGYKHLRAKLSSTLITRRTHNTFNGWKITKRESKWIDDVLTSPAVKPYAAAIMLTDSTNLRSQPVIITAYLRRCSLDCPQVLDRLASQVRVRVRASMAARAAISASGEAPSESSPRSAAPTTGGSSTTSRLARGAYAANRRDTPSISSG
jgi:hypothetical protein